MANTTSNKKRKPIESLKGFAVVVTDKDGMRFVRVRVNGHPTVCCADDASWVTSIELFREVEVFYDPTIAAAYFKDTKDLIRYGYSGTKVCPRPPFKAEVVPLSFKIG